MVCCTSDGGEWSVAHQMVVNGLLHITARAASKSETALLNLNIRMLKLAKD
jgi:hypothetical protein